MVEPARTADQDVRTWRVDVDRAACIGSGMCAGIAPGHFVLETGRSRPTHERVAPDDDVLDAAENCPVEAILVRNGLSGTVLAPLDGS
jgi:ferredoxin